MRILTITTWRPYPPDNGSKIRTAYLLRALAQEHDVTLLTFSVDDMNAEEITAAAAALGTPLAGVYPVNADPFGYNSLPAPVKYASPMPMAFWKNPAMAKQTAELGARAAFDAVVAMSIPVARYPFQLAQTPRLLDLEQSHTLVLEERYRSAQGLAARQRYRLGWRKSAVYEARFIRKYTVCTLVSQKEVDYYAPMIRGSSDTAPGVGATRLAVVPNGVDLERMHPGRAPGRAPGMAEKQAQALIFNGALTYSVNYDAMQYFLAEVYPRIRRQAPGVTLTITGSTQGVDLDALPLDESVRFSGYAPDIRPLVAGATVCVAPLRQGAGTRLKILEAMALGTPVVSTPKGMEGLDAVEEQHYLLGRDAEAFADQTVRLLNDETLRRQIAANARQLVETKYDWNEIGRVFRGLVEETAAGKGPETVR